MIDSIRQDRWRAEIPLAIGARLPLRVVGFGLLHAFINVDFPQPGSRHSVAGASGQRESERQCWRCNRANEQAVNGLYKAEVIHRRAPWKTKEAVKLATLEWVAWFNNNRLLDPIGYIPPAEAEANYYRQLASQAVTVAA